MVFINKMKKIIIKTCSCFLEKAVWFVNSPKRYPYWIFLSAVKDVGKKIFVSDEWNAFKTVIIISCCLDCVQFEAVQNSKIMQYLDNVQTKIPLVRVTMTKFLLEIVISGRMLRVKRLVLIRDCFKNPALQV